MPSPFSGMDPFLERPAIFGDLHDRMITYLAEALGGKLHPPYLTALRARIWVESSLRVIDPDVDVLRQKPGRRHKKVNSGVAVAERESKPIVVEVEDDEHRETYLEVLKAEEGDHRLVTAIEILSPSNKTPRSPGRKLYLRKQREVFNSKTHLVEIDLLRGGRHTTAVPLDRALLRTGGFDYHVCVHRYDQRRKFFVYPILLQQKLPFLDIPLLKRDGSVSVDLQAVFDRCYDVANYSLRARYEENRPQPALSPEQSEWATQLLREKRYLPRS